MIKLHTEGVHNSGCAPRERNPRTPRAPVPKRVGKPPHPKRKGALRQKGYANTGGFKRKPPKVPMGNPKARSKAKTGDQRPPKKEIKNPKKTLKDWEKRPKIVKKEERPM